MKPQKRLGAKNAVRLAIVLLGLYPTASGSDREVVGREVYERLAAAEKVRVVIFLEIPPTPLGRLQPLIEEVVRVQTRALSSLSVKDFVLKRRFQAIPALAGELAASGVEKLAALPGVRRIDLDVEIQAHLAEAVPLTNSDHVQALGYTGAGVTVAIIDTGIDTDHLDLADDLVGEVCFCSIDNGCCPNGTATQSGAGAAEDDNGHGSNVAGIVTSGGRVAPVGVAPEASVVAIKVLSRSSRGDAWDAIMALDWIITNRPDVRVVNMSLGSDDLFAGDCDNATSWNMAYASAINTLRANGVTIFASSGNSGSGTQMSSPACVSGAISVGAVCDADLGSRTWFGCTDSSTFADKVTCFSNSNPGTDLFAPGALLTSDGLSGGTSTYFGTSQASPVAAGCAADLLQAQPSLTPDQIEGLFKDTGQRVTDSKNSLSFARVDCLASLSDLTPPRCSQPLDVFPCDTLNFGQVLVNSHRDLSFKTTNSGTSRCCIGVSLFDPALSLISQPNFCLSSGETSDVVIRFSPSRVGDSLATVRFDSDVCNDELREVRGSGIGFVGTCGGPLPLSCGIVLENTNETGGQNIDRYYVDGSEHQGYSGPEQVHTLTIDQNDSTAIAACLDDCNNSGGGMDLFVCETCQSHTISSCRRFQDPNGRLSLDGLPSGTYYVIVDSYPGEGNLGEYRLQVDCCADRNGSTTCGTGACTRTVQNCLDGVPLACVPGEPTPEQCDGIDNDCDGSIDEGLSRTCSTACGAGVEYCVIGTWRGCTAPLPQPEVCDGLDNDCDGALPLGETDADMDGFMVCEGDCDDSDPRTYPGAPESNDARDNQCTGEPGHGLVDELSGLAGFMNPSDPNQFCWLAQAGATSYEVARADMAAFAGGCMRTIVGETCWVDSGSPSAGSAFFYLVRAVSPNVGSWGQDSSERERTQVCP